MTIGPITTVASEITNDRNTAQVRGQSRQGFAERSGVRATLTADVDSLSSLVAQAMQTTAIQQRRVEALRSAISNGSYTPDAHEIATSILEGLG